MLIFAHNLSRCADVVIHERQKIFGGAWSKGRINEGLVSTKTNVIVPLNSEQDDVVEHMNHYLSDTHDVRISTSTGRFQMEAPYKPREIYEYDLGPLFQIPLSDTLDLNDQSVERIDVVDHKVMIDGNAFDKVYFPYSFGLDSLTIDNVEFEVGYQEIVSEHLNLVLEGSRISEVFYTEEYDEYLDRVKIKSMRDTSFFVGRVSRNYKGSSSDYLIDRCKLPAGRDTILYSGIEKYANYYRDERQINALISACRKSEAIELVNTSNFVAGFMDMQTMLNSG